MMNTHRTLEYQRVHGTAFTLLPRPAHRRSTLPPHIPRTREPATADTSGNSHRSPTTHISKTPTRDPTLPAARVDIRRTTQPWPARSPRRPSLKDNSIHSTHDKMRHLHMSLASRCPFDHTRRRRDQAAKRESAPARRPDLVTRTRNGGPCGAQMNFIRLSTNASSPVTKGARNLCATNHVCRVILPASCYHSWSPG